MIKRVKLNWVEDNIEKGDAGALWDRQTNFLLSTVMELEMLYVGVFVTREFGVSQPFWKLEAL